MKIGERLVNGAIWGATRLLCRVDDADIHRVPRRGPLILITNHINFLDVPILYTSLQPRPLRGLAKVETWEHPFLRFFATTWGAIPIRRGEVDREALRACQASLARGEILSLAPEGTRSGNGSLLPGRPGVVLLALQSDAPLLPVVNYGEEIFHQNIRRFRRTDFHIRVGKPFKLNARGRRLTREVRQQMLDEIMGQMADVLPEAYRGVYRDRRIATAEFIEPISLG
jgi:1-acyl-sn-glycerol-3-phosphate acyltransferase